MNSAKINQKLVEFRQDKHIDAFINHLSFQEKYEYFSILVEKYQAFVIEKPVCEKEAWQKIVEMHKKTTAQYKRILRSLR